MLREAPAMTVRQNLGELLSEVQYRHDRVLITKAGKPVAALIDVALFERLQHLDADFSAMRSRMADAFADLAPDEVEDLVDEAVRAVRTKPAKTGKTGAKGGRA